MCVSENFCGDSWIFRLEDFIGTVLLSDLDEASGWEDLLELRSNRCSLEES